MNYCSLLETRSKNWEKWDVHWSPLLLENTCLFLPSVSPPSEQPHRKQTHSCKSAQWHDFDKLLNRESFWEKTLLSCHEEWESLVGSVWSVYFYFDVKYLKNEEAKALVCTVRLVYVILLHELGSRFAFSFIYRKPTKGYDDMPDGMFH